MSIFERMLKVFTGRSIILGMVKRNIKEKYVGSGLGICWALVNPLLIMMAVNFVFTYVLRAELKNFPLLILSGLLPWFFFVNSISESATSLGRDSQILSQFIMPKEFIPISVVISNFVNFLIGFLLLLPVFVFFNHRAALFLYLLPAVMLLHFAFTLGVSMLFSITNVYFRDLSQLLNVGIMFLFWMTPVFYPLEAIPQGYRWIVAANPCAPYISIYRSILYYSEPPGPDMWVFSALFSLVSFILGYFVFVKKEQGILKNA